MGLQREKVKSYAVTFFKSITQNIKKINMTLDELKEDKINHVINLINEIISGSREDTSENITDLN